MIVLHTTRTGENAIVVHSLSREYGRRSFIIKNLGSKRGKQYASILQPLSIIEGDIIESSKSDLYQAKSLTIVEPLFGIRGNLYKNTISVFLSEVLFKALTEGMSEDGLYDWCRNKILLLDALYSDFSNFHLRFLLEMTIILGFSPEKRDIIPFVTENKAQVEELMNCDFAESMLVPMSGRQRNEIAEGLLRYISYHSESSLNINSLKVLREIFQ